MSSNPILTETDFQAWAKLVGTGMVNAITGLSQMVETEIKVASLTAKQIMVKDTPQLLGGPEAPTAAVYLGVSGSANGHMVVVYQPQIAFDLIDMLVGNPAGTTDSLGEMEQSALGEVGNVMGSLFLNTLADATGADLRISPPAVMMDMAGAILDAALAEVLMDGEEALVVETSFGTEDRQIDGNFLVLPSPELQRVLIQHVQNL